MKTVISIIVAFVALVPATKGEESERFGYPPLEAIIANLGQGCRIKVDLPKDVEYWSNYETPSKNSSTLEEVLWSRGGALWLSFKNPPPPYWHQEWLLDFSCYHAEEAKYIYEGMLLNNATQEWVLNLHKEESYHRPEYDISGPISELTHQYYDNFQVPEVNLKIYQIKNHTNQGWLTTYDNTFGGREFQKFHLRNLEYCVFHNDRAICGRRNAVGHLKTIQNHPLADRTAYVLKMVKSIEFLEDVQPSLGNDVSQPRNGKNGVVKGCRIALFRYPEDVAVEEKKQSDNQGKNNQKDPPNPNKNRSKRSPYIGGMRFAFAVAALRRNPLPPKVMYGLRAVLIEDRT